MNEVYNIAFNDRKMVHFSLSKYVGLHTLVGSMLISAFEYPKYSLVPHRLKCPGER
jgi:hypothetical protein